MDANNLFLRRITQVDELSKSLDEIGLLDLSAHLRQLFFDQRSLIDAVDDGVKLQFLVGEFPPGWGPDEDPYWKNVAYQALQDGIDPQTSARGRGTTLNRNQFGKHTVAFSGGQKITIRDIVKYNADRRGGVHYDPSDKAEYRKLKVLESLYVGGIAAPTRELMAIGRVAVRSLEPLVVRVKLRLERLPTDLNRLGIPSRSRF